MTILSNDDLDAIRERHATYSRIRDQLGDDRAQVFARATAADVPALLAAVDEANAARAALAIVRGCRVDPALLRWCEWPGCWAHFQAPEGPVGQPGWIWASHRQLLLCPAHAAAGHIPDWTWNQTLRTVTAECSCGEAENVTPGNQDSVTRWWREHVTALAAKPA